MTEVQAEYIAVLPSERRKGVVIMRMSIDELIEESGLKHESIAKKLRITSRTLYSWRRSDTFPPLNKAVELAEILGVEINELYTMK